MIRTIWNPIRVMLLSPVALFLSVLFLPILIVSDNIPVFQHFIEFIHQNDSF